MKIHSKVRYIEDKKHGVVLDASHTCQPDMAASRQEPPRQPFGQSISLERLRMSWAWFEPEKNRRDQLVDNFLLICYAFRHVTGDRVNDEKIEHLSRMFEAFCANMGPESRWSNQEFLRKAFSGRTSHEVCSPDVSWPGPYCQHGICDD